MATNDCNKAKPCGCEDEPLMSLPPCNPIDCPDPIPCSEVINSDCVIYTGPNITCDQDTVVATGDTVAEALNDIVDYFCDNSGALTVVAAGDNIQVTSNTVGNVTTYTVNGKEAIVAAGDNIIVTSNTVGNDTTYTVNGKEAIVTAGTNVTVTSNTVGNDTTYTVNAACPIDVEIVRAGQDPAYFEAVVTGGTAPYTYTWSFPSTHNNDSASPNNSMYELSPIMGFPERMWATINAGVANVFDACTSSDAGRAALLKVVVTDANGCKAKDFHLITRVLCA